MPRMRITIEVEAPQFKTQGDRLKFNHFVLDAALKAFPGCEYVATEDVSSEHVLTHDGKIPTTAVGNCTMSIRGEGDKCALCGCFNGHSLSCPKILGSFIDHE